ncbi:MAG: hypothetical protein Q4D32_04560 [Eubacteriales bacterium]|nr:hypothetical protein [Eubacteriales bacterium]
MKKQAIKISSIFLITALFVGICASAKSSTFGGNLKKRVLDGSANGIYYNIGKNKRVSISGRVTKTGYNKKDAEINRYGERYSTQYTYINLYEGKASGKGNKICGDKVKVSDGSKPFSAAGKTTSKKSKYIYVYKPVNDGYDLYISGNMIYE